MSVCSPPVHNSLWVHTYQFIKRNYPFPMQSSIAGAVLRSVAPLAESSFHSFDALGPAGSALLHMLNSCKRLVVISGAGISTSSGIPDYRSPGRPVYRPLQHAQYMNDAAVRRRYWARSFIGYAKMTAAQPNAAHHAVAQLQREGIVSTVITQNVDRLHHTAGSAPVVELHGTIHEVECLHCNHTVHRSDIQDRMQASNAAWLHEFAGLSSPRPDGDVELPQHAYPSFTLPHCDKCGSVMLKPKVVFHGGSVPKDVSTAAADAVKAADGLLVVGSTLSTWSALRLVKQFHEQASTAVAQHHPIGIINFGETRADDLAGFKIQAHTSAVLSAAVAALK